MDCKLLVVFLLSVHCFEYAFSEDWTVAHTKEVAVGDTFTRLDDFISKLDNSYEKWLTDLRDSISNVNSKIALFGYALESDVAVLNTCLEYLDMFIVHILKEILFNQNVGVDLLIARADQILVQLYKIQTIEFVPSRVGLLIRIKVSALQMRQQFQSNPVHINLEVRKIFTLFKEKPLTLTVSSEFFKNVSFKTSEHFDKSFFSQILNIYQDVAYKLFSPLQVQLHYPEVGDVDAGFCFTSEHTGKTKCHQPTQKTRVKRSWYNPMSWISDSLSAIMEAFTKALEFVIEPIFEALIKFLEPIFKKLIEIILKELTFIFTELISVAEDLLAKLQPVADKLSEIFSKFINLLFSIIVSLFLKLINVLSHSILNYLFTVLLFYIYFQKFYLALILAFPVYFV